MIIIDITISEFDIQMKPPHRYGLGNTTTSTPIRIHIGNKAAMHDCYADTAEFQHAGNNGFS